MLSKIGEKEEKLDAERHTDAEAGVVVLQQTNQLRVSLSFYSFMH
jgi:hypothetical protein